jgi:hypothetical protein
MVRHPSLVLLPELQKKCPLWHYTEPQGFRLIAEMNNVKRVVLLFDGDAIIRTFLDKTSYLLGIRRSQA